MRHLSWLVGEASRADRARSGHVEWCIVWLCCHTLFGTSGALFLVLKLCVEQPLYSWDHGGMSRSPRAGEARRRANLAVFEIEGCEFRRCVSGAEEWRRVERDATCWGCDDLGPRRVGAGNDG